MKILLIQPPVYDFYITWQRTTPLGLAYIAAALQKAGHQVEILAALAEHRQKTTSLPATLTYLNRYYLAEDTGPASLFKNYSIFGMPQEKFYAQIQASQADLFGISVLAYCYAEAALIVARQIKQFFPDAPVVSGGPGVSAAPALFLRDKAVDFTVQGEGEEAICRLVSMLEGKNAYRPEEISGIGYKQERELFFSQTQKISWVEDLDSLPFPARDLLPLSSFTIGRELVTPLITSRGCKMRCRFCSIHLSMGYHYRTRSVANIVAEMEDCYKRHGISAFNFEDDNLGYDFKRLETLLDEIIQRFGKRKLKLFAMNGISSRELPDSILQKIYDAGFWQLNLTMGSSRTTTQKSWQRPTSPAFSKYFKRIRQKQLSSVTYIFLGVPGQSTLEMVESIIRLMDEQTLVGASVFYPVPGTPLFDDLIPTYPLDSLLPEMTSSSSIPLENDDFSRDDIVLLLKIVRLINFIKSGLDSLPSQKSVLSLPVLRSYLLGEKTDSAIAESKKQQPIILQNSTIARKIADWSIIESFFQQGCFSILTRRRRRKAQKTEYIISDFSVQTDVITTFLESAQQKKIRGVVSENQMEIPLFRGCVKLSSTSDQP